MDDAIMHYLKRKYNLLIGERTAEAIKIEVGSAYPLWYKPAAMEIKAAAANIWALETRAAYRIPAPYAHALNPHYAIRRGLAESTPSSTIGDARISAVAALDLHGQRLIQRKRIRPRS